MPAHELSGIDYVAGWSTGDWVMGVFTTVAAPVKVEKPKEVFTCAECGLTFDTRASLEAHIATAHKPVVPTTPAYVWAVVGIGAVLVIAVIVLIVRTRRAA